MFDLNVLIFPVVSWTKLLVSPIWALVSPLIQLTGLDSRLGSPNSPWLRSPSFKTVFPGWVYRGHLCQ